VTEAAWIDDDSFTELAAHPNGAGHAGDDPEPPPAAPQMAESSRVRLVTLDEFTASDEALTEPLVGDGDKRLMVAGSTTVYFGEGGSGKTTLVVDLACHLAAGREWLGFPIGRPCRVLLLENEGPRSEFRLKLRRKRATWDGPDLGDRLLILEEPWGQIDLRRDQDAAELAAALAVSEVDVLLAGPIRRLGLEGGGTPAETVAFMKLLERVCRDSGRPIAFGLVHHENKAGDISGAFEAEFDTVIHVKAGEAKRTQLEFKKSRWSSRIHRSRATLAWQLDRDGFELLHTDIDGDLRAEARTAEDEAALDWLLELATTTPGIARGAAETTYQQAHPERGSRARARRVIDAQIELAVELQNTAHPDPERRALLKLAIRNGERANAKYLYPANHTGSPFAEHPNSEDGELLPHPHTEPPFAVRRSLIEGTANGEHMAEGHDDFPF